MRVRQAGTLKKRLAVTNGIAQSSLPPSTTAIDVYVKAWIWLMVQT